MIINIRGTSGSGKSTLVRNVMEAYGDKKPIFVEKRRQPLGYILTRPGAPDGLGNGQSAFVVGHYETACGGCDTIPKLDRIYDVVRQANDMGHDVLFEGLLISAEVNRCQAIYDDGLSLIVLGLTEITIEECVSSVNIRRRVKNPDKEDVNPKNTEAKYKQVKRACDRLEEGGVEVHRVGRVEAMDILGQLLGLKA